MTGMVADTEGPRVRWWTPRAQRTVFSAVVIGGALLAFVLGMREVNDRPDLDVDEPRARVEGLEVTVQVTITNVTEDETYCPDVEVAAVDLDGLDLANAPAVPDLGNGRIEPGRSENYVAVLVGMSQQDFDERLSDYVAFVENDNPC